MSSDVGVGIIGYGYWGPNLTRNFMEADGMTVRCIADTERASLAKAGARVPSARLLGDATELIADSGVDLVVIATPVNSHYELAKRALEAGKHVLVTKPMTGSTEEAERLVELADKSAGMLAVDHTFVFTGAVRKIKQIIDEGVIGELLYYDSVRINLGLFQSDVNVIWDLAPHDASIIEYLIEQQPEAVSAQGVGHVKGQPENIAYVTLLYPGDLIAHIHVSWLAPVKVRLGLIGGTRQMIVYDDMQASEKVKIYDRGVEVTQVETAPEKVYDLRVGYRAGDMWAPKLDTKEALRAEVEHVRACVVDGAAPICDGRSGLRVVRLLEAATRSMHEGKLIRLD